MAEKIVFKKGLLSELQNVSKVNGQFLVTTDERAIYIDANNERIRLGDFIEVASSAELAALQTNASTTALYYVTDTNYLMKWSGTEWKHINAVNFDTEVTGAGEGVTLTYSEQDGKLILNLTNKILSENEIKALITKQEGEDLADLKATVAKLDGEVGVEGSVKAQIATAKTELIGDAGRDNKDSQTIEGAKKYADDKIAAAISSTYKPAGSKASADLLDDLLVNTNEGNVYNISDALVINAENKERFVENTAEGTYPAGTNVVVIKVGEDYKFDILAGFVDLTDYVTTSAMTSAIGEAKTALIGGPSSNGFKGNTILGAADEVYNKTKGDLESALTWGDFAAAE